MKQETLEEAADRLFYTVGNKGISSIDSFIKGAKWQAENMPIHILDVENTYVHIENGVVIVEKNDKTERMYSEEEVIELLVKFFQDNFNCKDSNVDKWFEQFKKK